MKIAIIHDWLVTNAGAEKVLRNIIDLYPDADIFSLVDFLSVEDRKEVVNGKSIKTSFIQNLPFAKSIFRNYLPLFPKAIESFDLSEYDLIISSSWAVAKGVKTNDKQTHICYCHTPIRYAWDLYDEYTSNLKQPKKFLVEKTLEYMRKWDIKTLDRVDCFIANSKFVAERIKRIYGRESTVIYPPVDVDKFSLNTQKENFYLTASRLVPYKKVKLIVEAFSQMSDKKLVVIGDGEQYKDIEAIAKSCPNIQVLGFCDDKILSDRMQKAKAFVYAAVEDFGIVPIEAMACGTPVIALDEGGTAETVVNGINGVHFKHQTQKDIIDAIKEFETLNLNPNNIRDSMLKYTKFKEDFKAYVDEKIFI
ncbi:MAG: glycosyltransferase family 4 protein [Epsilonproteobacteria bacterium]|nr:MAG: glycosyltransferase family 4 protein [Campylobacterota bacterium]